MYWREVRENYVGYERHDLYSNDGKRLALCDWVVDEKKWRVSCTPFHLIPYFKTLEEAKAYILKELFERDGF